MQILLKKKGYSLVLDEDVMMESDLLMIKLKELKEKKDILIENMQNSKLKNGVDEIIKVICTKYRVK